MKRRPNISSKHAGFSLVEVVLAVGVLSLAIVALLGLFGPTMSSVKNVVDTDQASAAVGRINTEIQRGMSFAEVEGFVTAAGNVFYIWKRQTDIGQPIEYVMSTGSPSGTELGADVDGDDTADYALDTDLTGGNIVGPTMMVTFKRFDSADTDYDYANVANEGYIPFQVSIYAIDPNQAGTLGDVGTIEASLDPIFSYPTAKTRSL